MTEQEWIQFLASGEPPSVSVVRLPSELSQALKCSSRLVQIHHAYAAKVHNKHGIDAHRLPMIGITIDLGRCVLDNRGHLQFFYFEQVIFSKWFHAVVKSNVTGDELWVSSFHHSKPAEVSKYCRRGVVLRPEKQ